MAANGRYPMADEEWYIYGRRLTGKEGMRCWALVLALMVEQGYRAITPKHARSAPPPALTRPAGATALLEAFGL